jgi:hypothetical protein
MDETKQQDTPGAYESADKGTCTAAGPTFFKLESTLNEQHSGPTSQKTKTSQNSTAMPLLPARVHLLLAMPLRVLHLPGLHE